MTIESAKVVETSPTKLRSATRSPISARLGLFVADLILINCAFALSYVVRYQWEWFRPIAFDARLSDYLPIQVLFNLALLAFFWLDGVYAFRRGRSMLDQVWSISSAVIKAVFIVWVAIFIYGPAVYSRLMIAEAGLITILSLSGLRGVLSWRAAQLRKQGIGVSNVLIIGAGELGRAVMRAIFARPDLGYRCIGFLDDDPQRGQTDIGRFPALGNISALPELLRRGGIDDVIIALPWSAQQKIAQLVSICQAHRVQVRIVPSLMQVNFSRLDVSDFGGIPLLTLREPQFDPISRVVKRAIDLVLGTLFLLVALPIMLIAGIAIRLESPGPIIYSQIRIGQNGRPFKVYKLRSMHKDADKEREKLRALNEAKGPIFKIREDPRLTRVGRLLRKLSIDELPQFWNVLRGDMSIVGPRPPLPEEVQQYSDWHHERLRVKPGITGLWQISGRSDLPFDEMVLLDVYYIENWSPALDLKIILATIPHVLSGRGAY